MCVHACVHACARASEPNGRSTLCSFEARWPVNRQSHNSLRLVRHSVVLIFARNRSSTLVGNRLTRRTGCNRHRQTSTAAATTTKNEVAEEEDLVRL